MLYHSNRLCQLTAPSVMMAMSLLSGQVALGKTIYKCASGGRVTFTDHPCEQAADVASQPADAERVKPKDCVVDRPKSLESNGKSSGATTGKQAQPVDGRPARHCAKDNK